MINQIYYDKDGKIQVRTCYLNEMFPKGEYKPPTDKFVDVSEEIDRHADQVKS